MTGITDCHCHLQDPAFDDDRAEVIDRARNFGVERFWVNGTAPDEWPRLTRLLGSFPAFHPFFGVHPWRAGELPVDWEARLRATLLSFPRAGVGEIGLDTRLTPLPLPVQLEVFRTQLRVAREMNRPCTVHLIGARAEALTSIRSEKPPRVLLHSFGGSAAEVSDWRTLPLWFSFGGGLLCDSVSDKRIAALRSVPADRLLLETDAPYQHPLGREHRMEPARLLTVAEAVAAFRGQRVEDLLQQVETNARNFINPGENS